MWTPSLVAAVAAVTVALAQSPTYGVGRTPGDREVRDYGVQIAPDGTGLPAGSGTAAQGRELFAAKCRRCHGENLEGGVGPALAGGQGTLATARPLKTVGSFWPHAPTVWDYVHRAMPFDQAGVLTNGEVYALVAYILFRNRIIDESQVMDARSLPKVRMPNRDGFVPDPRPDVKPAAKRVAK